MNSKYDKGSVFILFRKYGKTSIRDSEISCLKFLKKKMYLTKILESPVKKFSTPIFPLCLDEVCFVIEVLFLTG